MKVLTHEKPIKDMQPKKYRKTVLESVKFPIDKSIMLFFLEKFSMYHLRCFQLSIILIIFQKNGLHQLKQKGKLGAHPRGGSRWIDLGLSRSRFFSSLSLPYPEFNFPRHPDTVVAAMVVSRIHDFFGTCLVMVRDELAPS